MKGFAFSILGFTTGTVTYSEAKAVYTRLVKQFHPDLDPNGLEKMKVINQAWQDVKIFFKTESEFTFNEAQAETMAPLMDAIDFLKKQKISFEVCGYWIWTTKNERTFAVKDALKAHQFKWASKKKRWFFRPSGHQSRGIGFMSMIQIRKKYGSRAYAPEEKLLEVRNA